MKPLPSLILILTLTLGALTLSAADTRTPEQVHERMKTRLPAIDKLKKEGRVGENNRGYLDPRIKLSEREPTFLRMENEQGYLDSRIDLTDQERMIVKAENEDRKTVYAILAERTKTSIEQVQAVRARQIRDRSAIGLWLQDVEGRWFRKTEPPTPGTNPN